MLGREMDGRSRALWGLLGVLEHGPGTAVSVRRQHSRTPVTTRNACWKCISLLACCRSTVAV